MKNKYYILESSYKHNNKNIKKKYYATIIDNYETEEYIVNIGGINIKCISIQIPYKGNQAVILDISYYEKCALKDILKKNKDMIQLIKCSLIFTLHHFPQLKSFILSDNSYVECKNKIRLCLADLYYIKYQKTWYEKMFNAIPENNEQYKKNKLKMDKILNKKLNFDTEIFIDAYYDNEFDSEEIINKIKEIYKKDMTLKSFLEKIKDNECSYYSIIINKFFRNQLSGLNWIININDITNFNSNCNIIELEKALSKHIIINKKSDIEKRHINYQLETRKYFNKDSK